MLTAHRALKIGDQCPIDHTAALKKMSIGDLKKSAKAASKRAAKSLSALVQSVKEGLEVARQHGGGHAGHGVEDGQVSVARESYEE